jgi:hypothetical protein
MLTDGARADKKSYIIRKSRDFCRLCKDICIDLKRLLMIQADSLNTEASIA